MNTWQALALTVSMGVAVVGTPDEFIKPDGPFSPGQAPAPSPNVTNGAVFEAATLSLQSGQSLRLPETAVVEEYDGAAVRFSLTKSLSCSGQPPRAMRFDESREHFGIAQRVEEGVVTVATFGEWSNRGGTAEIRLLVLVPAGLEYSLVEGLRGDASAASSEFRFNDEALSDCYWYAGPRPNAGWAAIPTQLHYSRFLAPR